MFDQRGAMRSRPFCLMEENNPHHSVCDMEILRKHLKIDKWVVFGGSWGSSLGLLYGQEHSKHCLGFILRGIWLCRMPDYLHLFYDMGKIFPEAYDNVVSHIPENERFDLVSAYYDRVFHPDPAIHLPAVRIFMEFDMICATSRPNRAFVDSMLSNENQMLSVMRAFCFYAKNQFFLEPNQILAKMSQIGHLPAIIVQGRWDAICLPTMAYSLYQHWPNSALWMVPDGGHSVVDLGIARALSCATDLFAENGLAIIKINYEI